MATAFPLPVTAAQVGTYFVGQYYQMLQNQPDFVHQFYSDGSTVLRIDGNTRETAISMLQIHQLIMSLNYLGIEIKTAQSLESWNGGVLVVVSGSVHVKDSNGRKKFVETFFLAPQEKGYFVLNNIFHFVDEEQILQHPMTYLPENNFDSKLNNSSAIREQVSNYMLGGNTQAKECVSTTKIENNGTLSRYNYPHEQLLKVPQTEKTIDDNHAIQSNGFLQGTINSVSDRLSPAFEEPVVEPQKHTYASIVVKGQSASTGPSQASFNKPTPSELQRIPEPPNQPSVASSSQIDSFAIESFEEALVVGEVFTVEVKSVYVRNVPTTMAASDIGDEFKKFGKLKPDGVAIRTRKDIDVCYAFVEFEDLSGVQNAIKASTVDIGGHQLYIEGRRLNRNNSVQGGRTRGRGRVSYQVEGKRAQVNGRGFGREDGLDRDYNRLRGNGFYKQASRQERAYSASQRGSRNGQNLSL